MTSVVAQQFSEFDAESVGSVLCWMPRDRSGTETVIGSKRRQNRTDGGVTLAGETSQPDVDTSAEAFIETWGATCLGRMEVVRDVDHIWGVRRNPGLEAVDFLATAAGVDLVGLAVADSCNSSVILLEDVRRSSSDWPLGLGLSEADLSGPAMISARTWSR